MKIEQRALLIWTMAAEESWGWWIRQRSMVADSSVMNSLEVDGWALLRDGKRESSAAVTRK